MIYHGNRFTIKASATPEQVEEALESLRNQGRVIPSVKSFVVGPDYGGEYHYGAVFAIEDLEGYWEYLVHPAHLDTDRIGLPLVDKFMSFDITTTRTRGWPTRSPSCTSAATTPCPTSPGSSPISANTAAAPPPAGTANSRPRRQSGLPGAAPGPAPIEFFGTDILKVTDN
ncbi:Dabb family protein [Nocardia xishanensis]